MLSVSRKYVTHLKYIDKTETKEKPPMCIMDQAAQPFPIKNEVW